MAVGIPVFPHGTRNGCVCASVPPGGDAYLMRHIIHDWTDEQSLTILSHCRKVMKPGGRLLLVESVTIATRDVIAKVWRA